MKPDKRSYLRAWRARRKITEDPGLYPDTFEKNCSGCGRLLSLAHFNIKRGAKFGRSPECKQCRNKRRRDKYAKDPDPIKKRNQLSYKKHVEKRRESNRIYRSKQREAANRRSREFHHRHKHEPEFKIRRFVKNALRKVFTASEKPTFNKAMRELIGCTPQQLKTYIEKQFEPGMNWNNYNSAGWHIDHIIPMSAFDLSDLRQRKACFGFHNLRPMWAYDNMSKHDHMFYYKHNNKQGELSV